MWQKSTKYAIICLDVRCPGNQNCQKHTWGQSEIVDKDFHVFVSFRNSLIIIFFFQFPILCSCPLFLPELLFLHWAVFWLFHHAFCWKSCMDVCGWADITVAGKVSTHFWSKSCSPSFQYTFTKRKICHSILNLEKEMATHSSTLAWKIPWTEEPGRLQSTGWLRVGHDGVTSLSCIE